MYKWDTPRIGDLLSSFDYEALTKWDDLQVVIGMETLWRETTMECHNLPGKNASDSNGPLFIYYC